MFWGSLGERQQEEMIQLLQTFSDIDEVLLEDVVDDEVDSFKYESILQNTKLMWFQSFAVQHCMISKGTLVSLPTGTGKTLTAIAYINAVRQDRIQDTRAIFLCIPSSLEQIMKDFEEYSDLRIIGTSGSADDIAYMTSRPISFYDAYIVSTEALYSVEFCNWFVQNKDFIDICVLDEAHEVSLDSQLRDNIRLLFSYVEYKMELTATPLTVNPEQPLDLINMMDPDTIENPKRFLEPYAVRDDITFEILRYDGLSNMSSLLFPHYVTWTRKELGIEAEFIPKLYLVNPTEEQKQANKVEGYTILKEPIDCNQMKVLQALIADKTKRGLRGLVFADHINVGLNVTEAIRSLGVGAELANSLNTNQQRHDILKRFKEKDYPVLVTSITTALNLPCDYVIIYEQTNRASQLLGRPIRGFSPGKLEVDYILTNDTVEIEQFYDNVYLRSEYLRDQLGKDIDVFERFAKALEARGYKRGINK